MPDNVSVNLNSEPAVQALSGYHSKIEGTRNPSVRALGRLA